MNYWIASFSWITNYRVMCLLNYPNYSTNVFHRNWKFVHYIFDIIKIFTKINRLRVVYQTYQVGRNTKENLKIEHFNHYPKNFYAYSICWFKNYFYLVQILLRMFNIFITQSNFLIKIRIKILPYKFTFLSTVKNIWTHSKNIEHCQKYLNMVKTYLN